MIQKTFSSSIFVAALITANAASAGMVTDMHGNVGYDTAAECDAAVNAGTAKFYKSYTHKPALLRAGEKRVQAMSLKNLTTNDYARGACDIGAGHKAGRDGVAPALQGKYIPYSPDMPVNVYLDKSGVPVRASMRQCDNWFGANMPRPVPALPVATKVVVAPPTPVLDPAPAPSLSPAPVAIKPVTVNTAMSAAQGSIGYQEILSAAGVVVIGAALLHNSGDSGTTSTTGSTGTTGTK